MTSLEIAEKAVKILDSKKAQDIRAIRVRDLTVVADYFVIASGSSTTQVKALADEVEFKLGEIGLKNLRAEGYQAADWIVLDYGEVLIHIFCGDTRKFYSLERVWADGELLDIASLLEE